MRILTKEPCYVSLRALGKNYWCQEKCPEAILQLNGLISIHQAGLMPSTTGSRLWKTNDPFLSSMTSTVSNLKKPCCQLYQKAPATYFAQAVIQRSSEVSGG